MTADRIDRKLAAILAADVAGYSRLMGADEEGTLGSLNGHRREHIDPSIAKHRGRLPSGSRQLSRIIALINQRDSDFLCKQPGLWKSGVLPGSPLTPARNVETISKQMKHQRNPIHIGERDIS